MDSVREEHGVVAMGAGLETVSVRAEVIEADVVNSDVANTRGDDAFTRLRLPVGEGHAHYDRIANLNGSFRVL